MPAVVVSDSSCLIALERIGQLEVLPGLYGEIVVPPAVAREVSAPHSWLRILVPTGTGVQLLAAHQLHPGEAEAIALAREHGWRLLIDERRGRRIAQELGVRIGGIAGVLVEAKAARLIENVSPHLDALLAAGFHLHPRIMSTARRLAGEEV